MSASLYAWAGTGMTDHVTSKLIAKVNAYPLACFTVKQLRAQLFTFETIFR